MESQQAIVHRTRAGVGDMQVFISLSEVAAQNVGGGVPHQAREGNDIHAIAQHRQGMQAAEGMNAAGAGGRRPASRKTWSPGSRNACPTATQKSKPGKTFPDNTSLIIVRLNPDFRCNSA